MCSAQYFVRADRQAGGHGRSIIARSMPFVAWSISIRRPLRTTPSKTVFRTRRLPPHAAFAVNAEGDARG